MTAVHPNPEARPSSSHNNTGNPAFHFPRSGLGTPNWLDFGSGLGSAGGGTGTAGGGGGGGGMTTPSWFKGSTSNGSNTAGGPSTTKADDFDSDDSSNEENRPAVAPPAGHGPSTRSSDRQHHRASTRASVNRTASGKSETDDGACGIDVCH